MAQLSNKASRIFVSSLTKDSTETNARFTQRFAPSLTGTESISLVSASIPYMVYPFPSYANTLVIDDGTGVATYTIPNQTYDDGNDFATVMNSVFAGAGGNLSLTYDSNTNKFTLQNLTGSAGVTIQSSVGALKIGFAATQFGSSATSITADNMPRLDATQVIYVSLENIGQSGGDSQLPVNNILTQINVNTTFGGIIQQQTDVEEQALPTPDYINELEIRLLDENFRELELDANAIVCMEFYVKHRKGLESSI